MKINNKTLLIVLAGLILVLVIIRLTGSKRTAKTLNTELVQIDTSRITEISIFPSSMNGQEVLFTKNDGGWIVTSGDISAEADLAALNSALADLVNLKTERLVARTEDKWPEFQVGDSLGTRVSIREGRRQSLDLVIGRFDYQPPPGGYQGYGQNQFSGFTYVRNHEDKEVYAVEGFLALNFNRDFNAWRNQELLDLNTSLLSKMVFEYPADSGFIAQKSNAGWMVAGLAADSASVVNYLSRIARKRSSNFADLTRLPSGPDFRVSFEGENMPTVQVRGFSQPDGSFLLNSSSNPESWFRSDSSGIFRDIFIPSTNLLVN